MIGDEEGIGWSSIGLMGMMEITELLLIEEQDDGNQETQIGSFSTFVWL